MLLCFSLHHSSVPQCSKDKKKKKKEKTPSACLKSLCDLGPAYLRSPVSWNTIYCRPIQLHCVVPTPNSLRALSSCPWLRCCAYYSLYWGHVFPISVWLCSSLRSQLRWYFFFSSKPVQFQVWVKYSSNELPWWITIDLTAIFSDCLLSSLHSPLDCRFWESRGRLPSTYGIPSTSVKVGHHWMLSDSHRIVLDWMEYLGENGKSLKNPFQYCLSPFTSTPQSSAMYSQTTPLPMHRHMHTLAPSPAQN